MCSPGMAWVIVAAFSGLGASDVDIAVGEAPEYEVRFTSGKTVYVEVFDSGQWVGRYWGTDGHIGLPDDEIEAAPVFHIEIKDDPKAEEGTLLSTGWQWMAASEVSNTKKGSRHFVVKLSNSRYPVNVKVHTLLDGTAVLTRWLEITNTSRKPLALTAVAPWTGRLWNEDAPATLGCSIIQSNQKTGSFGWRSLKSGLTTIQNINEPCYDDPYFILRNESNGEYFFGQLAWPSIYRMEFHRTDHSGLTFRIEPIAAEESVLRVITAGETIATPAVHLCHTKGGFDAAVQAMHDHIRRSVVPERKPEFSYRIQYIANGDTGACLYKGDDFNEDNLKPCIDVATAVGAELFLVDGPMWAEMNYDPNGKFVGWNWAKTNKQLFPNGLRELSDYAHEKGLLFGAYARTEGLDSDHSRMADVVSNMIDTHGLDLYRHDTSPAQWKNRWIHSISHDGFDECILWRHYDTFYKTAELLHEKYPDVTLQQADAGGARSDLATVGHFHENFQSDLTPAPLVYQMMAGFSVYLPPEVMQGAYHGMWGETMPDKTTLKRCIYALGNIPSVYWTLLPKKANEIEPDELREWRKYSELYKTFIRPLLATCKVYHHAPINAKNGWDSGSWFAIEFTSPDQAKGWATLISYPESQSLTYLFKPKGLDARKEYRVTFDNTGKRETFAGSCLMQDGLLIQLSAKLRSELLLFEAQY